jgi:flagellin FlaB
MFEKIFNEDDRGQVGIGTLIVFIAMVLVAAIAAGVLINTAGFLQTQAEATGQESTDQVSDRIEVVSSVGIVAASPNTNETDEIRVSVTKAPGGGDIDLSATTIQVVGPEGQSNLVANLSANSVGAVESGEFAVKNDAGFVSSESNAVVGDGERFTIVINPAATGSVFANFPQGSEATLDIVAPSSATTSTTLNAPDLYGNEDEAVRL